MDLVQRFAIYRLMAIYLYANRHKTRPSRRATPNVNCRLASLINGD